MKARTASRRWTCSGARCGLRTDVRWPHGARASRPRAHALFAAAQDVDAAARSAWSDEDSRLALAYATPFMQAFGHTVISWMWLDVAAAASSQARSDLFRGKRMATRYFFDYELPKTAAW